MLFQTVTDPIQQADVLKRRRYGVIHTAAGRLVSIRLRPWPKIASVVEAQLLGQWSHGIAQKRRWLRRSRPVEPGCWLYYNQPLSCPSYLALAYGYSQRGCTLATVQHAARVLDEIARLKESDALLCDVAGSALSEHVLQRFGWEPHAPSRWHRNYIKRFYGEYEPPLPGWPVTQSSVTPVTNNEWAGGVIGDAPCATQPSLKHSLTNGPLPAESFAEVQG